MVAPGGTSLVYSTYLGPLGSSARALTADAAGDAYVTGITTAGFPVSQGAYQTTFTGQSCNAFAAELDPQGDFARCRDVSRRQRQ